MIFLTHKNKIILSTLFVLSTITAQTTQASSAYSATATYDFTITATNTNTGNNSLAGLTIGGSIDDFGETYDSTLDYSPVFTSGSSSSSSTLNDFASVGVSYTQIFHAEDSITAGAASSEYLASYLLTFLNDSADVNDIFDITIDYSYSLSTAASGQNSDVDISIALSNLTFDLDVSDENHASISGNNANPADVTDTGSFTFTLANGEYDALFVDSTLNGSLQASVVPVPAAFWLFGSALIALPGVRKLKGKA